MVISAYLNFTRFGLWAQLQQALSTVFPLTSPAPPVMLFDVTPGGDISITLLAYWKVERYLVTVQVDVQNELETTSGSVIASEAKQSPRYKTLPRFCGQGVKLH
jgi:hypothetical protein